MTRILYLENNYNSKWDEYVKQSPEGTFYHLTGWKKVIEKTLRLKPIYLMALNNADEIIGILPLFFMRDIVGRTYLVSIPFSAYAGVCTHEEDIKTRLFDKAKELAYENKVQYLEIRQLCEEVYKLPTKKDFVSMRLKLERDEEILWKSSLDLYARKRVRKASKKGITVDFGKNYLDEFYEILSANVRDLGSPNYPKLFLKNFIEEFSDTANLIVARYQNKIIGGMIFVGYKNIILGTWAASLREYNKLGPNDLVYWEAIRYACKDGYDYFDFGRSSLNSGTFDFKKKWGAQPMQLYYQYFFNKSQKIPKVSASENKYQLAISLWKKMPISVANVLGPRLIRYLPEL